MPRVFNPQGSTLSGENLEPNRLRSVELDSRRPLKASVERGRPVGGRTKRRGFNLEHADEIAVSEKPPVVEKEKKVEPEIKGRRTGLSFNRGKSRDSQGFEAIDDYFGNDSNENSSNNASSPAKGLEKSTFLVSASSSKKSLLKGASKPSVGHYLQQVVGPTSNSKNNSPLPSKRKSKKKIENVQPSLLSSKANVPKKQENWLEPKPLPELPELTASPETTDQAQSILSKSRNTKTLAGKLSRKSLGSRKLVERRGIQLKGQSTFMLSDTSDSESDDDFSSSPSRRQRMGKQSQKETIATNGKLQKIVPKDTGSAHSARYFDDITSLGSARSSIRKRQESRPFSTGIASTPKANLDFDSPSLVNRSSQKKKELKSAMKKSKSSRRASVTFDEHLSARGSEGKSRKRLSTYSFKSGKVVESPSAVSEGGYEYEAFEEGAANQSLPSQSPHSVRSRMVVESDSEDEVSRSKSRRRSSIASSAASTYSLRKDRDPSYMEDYSPMSHVKRQKRRLTNDGRDRHISPINDKDPTPGVRRSKRVRFRPLKHYEGERMLYQRAREEEGGIKLAAVVSKASKPLEFKTPVALKRKGLARKNVKPGKVGDVAKLSPPKIPKSLSLDDPSSPVQYLNTETGDYEEKIVIRDSKELIMNILPGDSKAKFTSQNGEVIQARPTQAAAAFDDDRFVSGVVVLPPLSKKPTENTSVCTQVFVVQKAQEKSVCVTVSDRNFTLSEGDHFWVPVNTYYSMQNFSEEIEARLAFVLIKSPDSN